MKKHMLVKGAEFINKSTMKVLLIPQAIVKEKVSMLSLAGAKNLNEIMQQVQKQQEPVDIVYITPDEWKAKGYSFASHVVLEIHPE